MLSVGACTEVEDWVIITVFLIPHVHVFSGICHYRIPLFRDLPDNGRVEAHLKVDKWLLVSNRAIIGLNNVSSVCGTEYWKQIYNKLCSSHWVLYILLYFIFVRLSFYRTWLSSIWLSRKTGYLTLSSPPPMPPHVLCGLRGLPSWARQECNRLLKLGRPWGAVTLSRWCVSGDRGECSARRGLKPKFY